VSDRVRFGTFRRAVRRTPRPSRVLPFGLLLAVLPLAACAGSAGRSDQEQGEVVVLAAASLADALEELAGEFAADGGAGGGARVVLDLAGSQTLATRIVEGAPADLLISADTTQMAVVAAAGMLATEPVTLVTNVLTVVVEAGNPRGVTGIADLAREDLIVVLAAEEVPAGRYTAEILARAGIEVRPASLERSVRAALAKVTQGEADAAVVYVSDAVAALRGGARVAVVPIPADQNVVARYPMALVRGGGAPEAAQAFAAFLLSERGRAVLERHGFGAP
jgi:molybdate transport system substrate-binding protein